MCLIRSPHAPASVTPSKSYAALQESAEKSAALAGTKQGQLKSSLATAEARWHESEARVRDVESEAARRTRELMARAEAVSEDAAARIAAKAEEVLRLAEELREAREVVARAEEVGGAAVFDVDAGDKVFDVGRFGVAGEFLVAIFVHRMYGFFVCAGDGAPQD